MATAPRSPYRWASRPRPDAAWLALEALLLSVARRRRTASHTERARQIVTKAMKGALARITERHPRLGRHLAATVRRGYFCVYRPDPERPISWAN